MAPQGKEFTLVKIMIEMGNVRLKHKEAIHDVRVERQQNIQQHFYYFKKNPTDYKISFINLDVKIVLPGNKILYLSKREMAP